MKEEILHIDGPDGKIEIFITSPDTGPAPPVILYMDAPGIREELYGFCRRITGEGYTVLLPDMYYRLGRKRFDLRSTDARASVFEAMRSLNNRLVMEDTRALLQFMKTAETIKPGPVGCLGYCMSGQYVMSAMGTFPRYFAAGAALYGVSIVTEASDSPHKLAKHVSGELYFGFAEKDEWVPDTVIPALRNSLDAYNVSYALDIWPQTQHGFCFPERDVYHEVAAEAVWQKVFDLYQRRLRGARN